MTTSAFGSSRRRSPALARRLEHQWCACSNDDHRGRGSGRDLDNGRAGDRPRRDDAARLQREGGTGDAVAVSAVAAAGANVTLTLASALAAVVRSGTRVQKLRPAVNAAVLAVTGAARLYPEALVQLEGAAGAEILTVVAVGDGTVTLSAAPGNTYFEGESLSVVEGDLTVRYRPPGGDEEIERISGLRLTNDAHPDSFARKVNSKSRLVRAQAGADFDGTDLQAFPAVTTGPWAPLGGGDDALASLGVDDFVGLNLGPGQRTGIQALEDIDQVAICAVPGHVVGRRPLGADHPLRDAGRPVRHPRLPTGSRRAGGRGIPQPDRHQVRGALLPLGQHPRPSPGRRGGDGAAVGLHRGHLRAHRHRPRRPQGTCERGHPVDPRLRAGDHEARAGHPQPAEHQRAAGVPGRGNRVWGARVLTSAPAWRYVSVRRLFLMIEESIDEATQWVVFEPNDEPLWARIRQSVTRFLITQWRIGALQGATADEAFFVACDRSTMTQDDIDNGRLICEIGIAPVKPAEFVIFRIQQKTLETVTA